MTYIRTIRTKNHILYKLMLETGMRYTECSDFINRFDKKNVELVEEDGICIYSNFYLRGQKKSYYLFFTQNTYNLLLKHMNKIRKINFNYFPKHISRQKGICSLKYLRKFQFNLLIEKGVSIEVSNFIQGRSSNDVGINHYLAKKKVSIDGYRNVVGIFDGL